MALLLGGTVAVTHTLSVLVFGGIVSLTETVAPENLYPLFGVTSGLLFVGLGVTLLRQVLRRGRASGSSMAPVFVRAPELAMAGAPHVHIHDDEHDHDHHHDHDHDHDGWHEHSHADLGLVATDGLSWRAVVIPGLAGGLIPSPSALLVFLGGLALGRAWFGVGLVVGYGIGIAITLVTAGWLLSRAGDALTGSNGIGRWPRLGRMVRYLPAATAVLVILGGLHVALRAIAQA
jgi:ABC-type nickel/cobalt efflux system permease component RcnA